MNTSVDVLAALLQIADGEGDTDVLAMRVHAAVAELIEAVEDEKYKSGPQFTCEEWLESSRRVRYALAGVKGA